MTDGKSGELPMWWDDVDWPTAPRPALHENLDVDVAVVGGGFTGLWTAYSLVAADPGVRVVVLERHVVGFGASGRNGGWCSALFPVSDGRIHREHGAAAAAAMRDALRDTVDAVGATTAAEGIDCRFHKGGTVVAARSPAQVTRARSRIAAARRSGIDERDLRWLGAGDAGAVIGAEGVLGATYTPHCAALQPALLCRGLADAAERRGVVVYEGTAVTAIEPIAGPVRRPRVRTGGGTVTADVVVRALEGWTPTLRGFERILAPLYSLMIATEPLPEEYWRQIGLSDRQTFADHRNMVVYGQRTADGRLAFGGRGAPYHYGSAVNPRFDGVPSVHRELHDALVEMFPVLATASITHRWGGPLGIARDWCPSVGHDTTTGIAWAGGYAGDGVAAANLAGRTLRDLILGEDGELTRLPWVNHRSPRWEPEPLRWLGVNAGLWATRTADRGEQRSGRPSRLAALVGRFTGQ